MSSQGLWFSFQLTMLTSSLSRHLSSLPHGFLPCPPCSQSELPILALIVAPTVGSSERASHWPRGRDWLPTSPAHWVSPCSLLPTTPPPALGHPGLLTKLTAAPGQLPWSFLFLHSSPSQISDQMLPGQMCPLSPAPTQEFHPSHPRHLIALIC
jgi:hypothetical protein